jgi:uncharacterized protein YjbI with pentapeptide repeats
MRGDRIHKKIMAEDEERYEDPESESAWPKCSRRDCIGRKVGHYRNCLEHLSARELDSYIKSLHPGASLDVSGSRIGLDLLHQLLDGTRDETDGTSRIAEARFVKTTFTEPAMFMHVSFEQGAVFWNARFEAGAGFDSVTFRKSAEFDNARFGGPTVDSGFLGCQFLDRGGFAGVKFEGGARFRDTLFSNRNVGESELIQQHSAVFEHAHFAGEVHFNRVRFLHGATFRDSAFERTADFRPIVTRGAFQLDGAIFKQLCHVEAAASVVTCVSSRFEGPMELRARWARILLDLALIGQPAAISHSPLMRTAPGQMDPRTRELGPVVLYWYERGASAEELERWRKWLRKSERALESDVGDARPKVISLRGVDLTNLTLSDVNLQACLFDGAFHLDRLKIEGSKPFAGTPRGLRVKWSGLPRVWWWTRRQVLAEEHRWRSSMGEESTHPARTIQQSDWYPPNSQASPWVEMYSSQPSQVLGPDELAGLYRDLRKAYEDAKNEPGAADFYFGEMEMRRLASSTPPGERILLFLYWLVSGYGLRGSRALIALMVTTGVFALLFQAWGFVSPGSFTDALLFSLESTTSLFARASEVPLTRFGEALWIVLRLLGPLLFGLIVLSIRGRVKR